jgi:hypothetical protein
MRRVIPGLSGPGAAPFFIAGLRTSEDPALCINRTIPTDDHEERLDEPTARARDDTDLFGTLASWLRELLDEGRQS